jgi:hypothetical protein
MIAPVLFGEVPGGGALVIMPIEADVVADVEVDVSVGVDGLFEIYVGSRHTAFNVCACRCSGSFPG